MAKSEFTRLADLLPKVMNHFKVTAPVQGAQIVNRWDAVLKELLPDGVIHDAKALHVKNGALTVEVRNSALAQTIQMHQEQIIDALNKDFPGERVLSIKFRNV